MNMRHDEPLTSDTITDQQITELRAWLLTQYTSMIEVSRGNWVSPEECVRICDCAIEELFDACDREPMPYRAHCAEILEALRIGSQPRSDETENVALSEIGGAP